MRIRRDRALRTSVSILVVFLVVAAGPLLALWIGERIYLSTLSPSLSYEVRIISDGDLSDVTFFLPLSAHPSGRSPFIGVVGDGNITLPTDDWQYEVYGANNETLLKLWTDRIPASSEGVRTVSTIRIQATPSGALHTRDPVTFDYTLLPKQDLREVSCPFGTGPGSPRCFGYQSLLFASYQAGSDTHVSLEVETRGDNHWEILGTYDNGYWDRIRLDLQGPVSGWYKVSGVLASSLGDSNEFWREPELQAGAGARPMVNVTVDTSQMRWHTSTGLP